MHILCPPELLDPSHQPTHLLLRSLTLYIYNREKTLQKQKKKLKIITKRLTIRKIVEKLLRQKVLKETIEKEEISFV